MCIRCTYFSCRCTYFSCSLKTMWSLGIILCWGCTSAGLVNGECFIIPNASAASFPASSLWVTMQFRSVSVPVVGRGFWFGWPLQKHSTACSVFASFFLTTTNPHICQSNLQQLLSHPIPATFSIGLGMVYALPWALCLWTSTHSYHATAELCCAVLS